MLKIRKLCVFALLLGSVGCKNGKKTPSTKPVTAASNTAEPTWRSARTFELYFTTGTLGYVEPCGCTSKPMGGLHRLASIIKSGHKERLLLDAGNLLLPKKDLDETTKEQHILKAELLARMYRKLGVEAVNVGIGEFGVGSELLKKLQREGAVPLVSANVRPDKKRGPVIAKSFVRKAGGVNVGITGVSLKESYKDVGGVQVAAINDTLAKEIGELKKQNAEILVLLADVDASTAEALAKENPSLDFILRSPGTEITRKPSGPKQIGNVVIIESGSQGQYVGKLTFALNKTQSETVLFDDGGYAVERKRALINRKITALHRDIKKLSEKEGVAAEAVTARQKQLLRLESRREGLGREVRPNGPNAKYELIALTEDVKGDADMMQVLKSYYAKLEAMNLKKGDLTLCKKKKKEDASYIGNQACVECHEEAFDFWKKTKHAVAWKTLEDDNKHFDLTCIGCHVVGYQEPGGFCRLSDVGNFKDVGCENCHGPGSIHVEDEDPDSIILASTEATCAGFCHVPEHSDKFEYTSYLKQITGEGHELSEASLPAP